MTNSYTKILVFGNGEAADIAKILWSQLSGLNVRVVPTSSAADVEEMALDAIMIVWAVDNRLSLIHGLIQKMNEDPLVTAEMMAVTVEKDLIMRLKLMSAGFDSIFNRDILSSPEFSAILRNKVAKGQARLMRRVHEEEFMRLRAALSTSPDAYIIFDENKCITFLSEHYARVYPQSAPKMVPGTTVKQALSWVLEETGVDESHPSYEHALQFWSDLKGSTEFFLRNNKILRIKATPLPNGRGTIVTTTDVTEYKRIANLLEQKSGELEKALESEREASATQRQFIAMVSHEFRTPLTIIDGNAQLIERQGSAETLDTVKKRARTIRSGVSRLIQMMEGVLSSNLARTGKLEPARGEFDLKALIEELAEEQRDLSRNLIIETTFHDIPRLIKQDRKFLILVFTNLISNAVKFSRENPIIQIQAAFLDHRIIVKVIDNGIGIPEAEIQNVFKKFFRASNATSIPGTGFGMSLTKDLVEALGGQLFVESKVNVGTTFTVDIPVG